MKALLIVVVIFASLFPTACDSYDRAAGEDLFELSTDSAEEIEPCATLSLEVEPGEKRPVDFVFVVDNSGSMYDEIRGIEEPLTAPHPHGSTGWWSR